MRKARILVPSFAILIILTLMLGVRYVSSATTNVYVDPPISFATSGESFTVKIMVSDVVNLYAWQVNMSFDPNVLESVNTTRGEFLAEQPEGTDFYKWIDQEYGWVLFEEHTLGQYPGVSGSGWLGTAEFRVIGTGECILNITHPLTLLLEMRLSGETDIDHTRENGFFTNIETPPHAEFTYSPSKPRIDEIINFDASASTATPPRQIVQYKWDFGDGTTKIYVGANLTAVTNHTFAESGVYTVYLTVVDDASASDLVNDVFGTDAMPQIWYDLYSTSPKDIKFLLTHDVTVTAVDPSPTTVKAGDTVSINVTIFNNGREPENVDVIVYADKDETVIGDEFATDSETVTNLANETEWSGVLSWDTTGVPGGTYRITAKADVVGDEYPADNTMPDGTVTVKSSGMSFSPLLIVGIVVVVAVVGAGLFLYIRRRGGPPA